jgi:hypothetical protein
MISAFRELNAELKKKPYPLPKIAQMLHTSIRLFLFCDIFRFKYGLLYIASDYLDPADAQK